MAGLRTVATFDNAFDAGYWQGLLEAQGIPVALIDQEIVAMEWQIGRAVGNIKLQVPEPEAERAQEILDKLRAPRHDAAPAADSAEQPATRALRSAFLGLGFPPLQIHSLWVLAGLVRRWDELPAAERRRARIAALLDLWLPIFAFGWLVVALELA